jgi:hypothetical protein
MKRRTIDTDGYPPILYSAFKWGYDADEIRAVATTPHVGERIHFPHRDSELTIHLAPHGGFLEVG